MRLGESKGKSVLILLVKNSVLYVELLSYYSPTAEVSSTVIYCKTLLFSFVAVVVVVQHIGFGSFLASVRSHEISGLLWSVCFLYCVANVKYI